MLWKLNAILLVELSEQAPGLDARIGTPYTSIYVTPDRLDLPPPAPGQPVLLQVSARRLTPSRWLEIDWSTDRKEWSPPVYIVGPPVPGKTEFTDHHHWIHPGLLRGPAYLRLKYRESGGYSNEDFTRIRFVAFHYLKADR